MLGLVLGLVALLCWLAVAEPEGWVTVQPEDTGEALVNPGMGWCFHHYDNSIGGYGPPLGPDYDGSEFPGLSCVYLRLAWSHLEPAEGQFNWSILDTVIQRYAAAGKQFALRLTVFEGLPGEGTPDWVREAGAKGYMVDPYENDTPCWEPDYDDPLFLMKLAAFLDAAGTRYGANPDLAFVDVGTLGIWGEGHPVAKRYTLATLRRHIELHQAAFKRAPLLAGDDWAYWFREEGQPDDLAMRLSRELGLGFRDDSICVYPDPKQAYSADLADLFWRDRLVAIEMGHYDYAKQVGAWGDGSRYEQAMEDYHASFLSIHANPHDFLAENGDLIRRMNQRVGYRLQLVEASWPETASREGGLALRAKWRNGGVAPCLPGGTPCWTLLDEEGRVRAVLADEGFEHAGPRSSAEGRGAGGGARTYLPPAARTDPRRVYAVRLGRTAGRHAKARAAACGRQGAALPAWARQD